MKLDSKNFTETVKKNSKADLIPKGTEFKVYDMKEKYICTIVVHKTTITYLDVVKDIPNDLLIDGYNFVEVE